MILIGKFYRIFYRFCVSGFPYQIRLSVIFLKKTIEIENKKYSCIPLPDKVKYHFL